MNRKSLITISIGVVIIALFLAGLIFFKKDQGGKILDKNKPENNQVIPPKPESKKISEEEKIKTMAENFAESYYSYTWGEFGMIEGLYYYMTDEMKEREMARVEGIKKEIEGQPRKYFTVRAKAVNSEFVKFEENIRANLIISLEVKEINGTFVTDTDVPEIKPQTTALVDGNGNVYNGDMNNLIINTTDKNVEIDLVKIDDKWKVDRIGN